MTKLKVIAPSCTTKIPNFQFPIKYLLEWKNGWLGFWHPKMRNYTLQNILGPLSFKDKEGEQQL